MHYHFPSQHVMDEGVSQREHSPCIRSSGAKPTQVLTYSAQWCSPKCHSVHACVCGRRVWVCVCRMRLRECVSPRRSGSVSAHIYQMDMGVSSFCHDANTSSILLITCNVDCFAVRTLMLVHVKRSDSSMVPHMHHILLKVHIWTWFKSYMLRKRFSNDTDRKKECWSHMGEWVEGWMLQLDEETWERCFVGMEAGSESK